MKPFSPPSTWPDLYSRLVKYRKHLTAPVDTIGCHCLFDKDAPKAVQRFQTLVALMLSSQTKDEITADAMHKLMSVGLTPASIQRMTEKSLNQTISRVGFHNNKAKYIKAVAEILIRDYNSTPPTSYEEVINLPGVGPKMAHLFLQAADNKVVGIGVDTHVHRISQRFQWVPSTVKSPEDTRKALEAWVPVKYWSTINPLLVGLGQTICAATRPQCSSCELSSVCPSAFSEEKGKKRNRSKSIIDIEDVDLPSRRRIRKG